MTELLVDGKNAFPWIISCIRRAKKSIYINMFIWRNDCIGNLIAEEVLAAAERGVHVHISKDRYGIICESCEETRKSFFHRRPVLKEKISISALHFLYARNGKAPFEAAVDDGGLLGKILSHPNITVEANENKYDHSKFYVFDDKTVILGGVNIEDKENSVDYFGRSYRDYMIIFDDPQLVDEFLTCRKECKSSLHFGMNIKKPLAHSGMQKAYLDLITSSKEFLTIVMAYFSPLPDFEKAILEAAERNVKVKIIIPRKANFQDNLNKYTVHRLLKKSGGRIEVYTYPQMLHAKLLMNESKISLGSCNITKKAFNQLDELNTFLPNDSSSCALQIRNSVEESLNVSDRIDESVKYNLLAAKTESLFI